MEAEEMLAVIREGGEMVGIDSLDAYQKLAQRTANPELSDYERLACAGLGLAGEAGEVADHIKKVVYHGHDLDQDYVVKELGDSMWYISEVLSVLEKSMSFCAAQNIGKLLRRYPSGFSVERSRNRNEG